MRIWQNPMKGMDFDLHFSDEDRDGQFGAK